MALATLGRKKRKLNDKFLNLPSIRQCNKSDEKFVKVHAKRRICEDCKNKSKFKLCEERCDAVLTIAHSKKSKLYISEYFGCNPENLEIEKFINARDINGRTVFHYAVAQCDVESIHKLISYGADPLIETTAGHSLLWFGILTDCKHTIQALVTYGCNLSHRAHAHFSKAIENNLLNTAQTLLHYGFDVNRPYTEKITLLHKASRWGRKSIVKMLIYHRAEIDALDDNDETPLFYAIDNCSYTIPPILLEHGANVNHRNKQNVTVLHLAIDKAFRTHILRLLLTYGADIDATTCTDETPLHHAAKKGCYCTDQPQVLIRNWQFYFYKNHAHFDVAARLLLKHGAKVNVRNSKGETPLHLAVRNGCPYLVQQLLDADADIDAMDHDGNDPLRIAVNEKLLYIIKQLLVAGADPRPYLVNDGNNNNNNTEVPQLTREVAQVFAEFFIAKRVAGLKVDSNLLSSIKMNEELIAYEESCSKEVNYMRTAEAKRKGVTLLNFLRANRRCLAGFYSGKNEKFLHFVTKQHFTELPIYRDMLERNFILMLQYGPIFADVTAKVNVLTQRQLPELLLNMVVSKLSIDDMKSIVEKTKSIARH